MVNLFSSYAKITSPFLQDQTAEAFFSKVFGASAQSTIHLYDIFQSVENKDSVNAYFRYDWTLKDGTQVHFDCIDLFEFDANGLISKLTIIYDTAPIRNQVGDKYA